MKRISSLVLAVLMVLSLVVCGGAIAEEGAINQFVDRDDDGKIVIGFLSASISSQPLLVETGAFEAKAYALGADEVIVLSAEDSVETQLQQMEDLITRGCDAIAIYAADSDGIIPGVERAAEAGIAVVAVDRAINTESIYYTIASNNISDGRDICNYFGMMTAEEPAGSVKVLNCIGSLSSIAQYERGIGFRDATANWPQLTIVGEPATEGDAQKTYDAVVDAFKTDPDIRCIMVTMDFLCANVTNALKDIGKWYPVDDPRHVYIGGVDGGEDPVKVWLENGECDVSISLDFQMFGEMAAEAAVNYAKGEYVTDKSYQTTSYILTPGNIAKMRETNLLWAVRDLNFK